MATYARDGDAHPQSISRRFTSCCSHHTSLASSCATTLRVPSHVCASLSSRRGGQADQRHAEGGWEAALIHVALFTRRARHTSAIQNRQVASRAEVCLHHARATSHPRTEAAPVSHGGCRSSPSHSRKNHTTLPHVPRPLPRDPRVGILASRSSPQDPLEGTTCHWKTALSCPPVEMSQSSWCVKLTLVTCDEWPLYALFAALGTMQG